MYSVCEHDYSTWLNLLHTHTHTGVHTCTEDLLSVVALRQDDHFSHRSVWNRLKWSLNEDWKSKCVCTWLQPLAFTVRWISKWEKKSWIYWSALIIQPTPCNIIQCVVCLRLCPMCKHICVFVLSCQSVTLPLVWLARPLASVKGGGCQVVGNSPLTHTVYWYWGLALRFCLSQSLWLSLIMSC